MQTNGQSPPSARREASILLALALLAALGAAVFQHILAPRVLARLSVSRLTPVFLETLELRIATAWGLSLALAGLAGWTLRRPANRPSLRLAAGLIGLAILLRVATPEMAFNSIVRPDGVHFSAVAQRLVTDGALTVPTGPETLPARTLPGESFVQAATQWLRPGHPGAGIGAVWLCAIAVILLAGRLASRFHGPRAGWTAMLLLALSPLHGWYSRQLMSEIPWGLLVLAAAGALAAADNRPGRMALAGFLAGLGLLFKSSHLLIALGLFLGWWVTRRRSSGGAWRAAGAWAAGLLLGAVPLLLYNRWVLGGWFRNAYEIYWPGWATASQALNMKYLWSPPLIKGSLGNVPYYLLALLGLDPRPERMPLLPGLALVGIALWWRGRRARVAASPEAARLRAVAAGATLLYGGACLLYSFQDPRLFLPIFPLLGVALAEPLRRGLPAGPAAGLWLRRAGVVALAGLIGVGLAIVRVETTSPRVPERELLRRLDRAAAAYDALISDEDPVLLTQAGVWGKRTVVRPLLLPGELWFPESPARLFRERGVAVEPFDGTVEWTRRALAAGRRVAAYIRRPHDRPEAWDRFQAAFELTPVPDSGLPWLRDVRLRPEGGAPPAPLPATPDSAARPAPAPAGVEAPPPAGAPDFVLGAVMPGEMITARERSQPPHPVTLSPFWIAPAETDQGSFANFLNDAAAEGRLRVTPLDEVSLVEWECADGTRLPVCRLDEREPNCGLRYDAESDRPFQAIVRSGVDYAAYPVVLVSWYGAALYCNWRSRVEGRSAVYDFDRPERPPDLRGGGYRLPTEAEWEWAATWDGRAKRVYAWGDDWNPALGNVAESPRPPRAETEPFTVPVAARAPWTPSRAPSPGGWHLTGNVWEWCQDWYADYTPAAAVDPRGPDTGDVRSLRGGSFRTTSAAAWAAFRGLAKPDTMTGDIGFRIARSLPR